MPVFYEQIGQRPIKRRVFIFIIFLAALAAGGRSLKAQSALDGYDPNANGTIRAMLVQPDGKILIGGDFTTLSGGTVAANYIARINPDGSIDTTFHPNANSVVYALALQSDGKVLAGGVFTSIGGQPRNFLARLDATTGAADSFNPNPNSDVLAIAVQPGGKILVGGDFNQSNGTPTIGGQTRNYIARLDSTTGLADSFNPNASDNIDVIVLEGGRILVGGAFNTIGGQTRHHLARLDINTGLADSTWAPDPNGIVHTIALQADGKVLVGGEFFGANNIGGQSRNYIARVDSTTGLADPFNPSANGQVNAIAVQADGKVLVGGLFTGTNSIGSQTRSRLARLDPITGLADSYNPTASNPVLVIALQPDGKCIAGGQFVTMAPNGGSSVTRNHIARLELDGRLDQTFPQIFFGAGTTVYCLAVQPDGKILLGGDIFRSIMRINIDATTDTTFTPATNGYVRAIALQTDGKILIGGDFTTVTPTGGSAVTRNRIARLNADGTLDTGFNPNADSTIHTIEVQADGQVLVGGDFLNIGGQMRSYVARLDASTGQADSFNPMPNASVLSIVISRQGTICLGGNFTTIGSPSQSYPHFAQVDATNGLPTGISYNLLGNAQDAMVLQPFGPYLVMGGIGTADNYYKLSELGLTSYLLFGQAQFYVPNNTVRSIALQGDGKILFGGDFTHVCGLNYNHVARVSEIANNGDDFFNPNVSDSVYAIALQTDGKILVGGTFQTVNASNLARHSIARLTNTTIASQDLTATPTTVTWTLGGSYPQFEHVTFETSTDSSSYSLLGNPNVLNNVWTLSGVTLPIGQSIYLRARGYASSGGNGSGSIIESVRNAFIVTLQINSVTHPATGHFLVQGKGLPNAVHTVLASPDLSSDSFSPIGTTTADASGSLQYDDGGAVGLTKRFYKLSYP